MSKDKYITSGVFSAPDSKVGYSFANQGGETPLTWRESFTAFWNVWVADLVNTDYALLDEILPSRIKTGWSGWRRPDMMGKNKP